MSSGFIVTGTDTGIGKTVFSAALAGALGGYYWKPVQAGLEGETDSDAVRRLSGLPPERILPEPTGSSSQNRHISPPRARA